MQEATRAILCPLKRSPTQSVCPIDRRVHHTRSSEREKGSSKSNRVTRTVPPINPRSYAYFLSIKSSTSRSERLRGPSASIFKLVTAAVQTVASSGDAVNRFATYAPMHVSPRPLRPHATRGSAMSTQRHSFPGWRPPGVSNWRNRPPTQAHAGGRCSPKRCVRRASPCDPRGRFRIRSRGPSANTPYCWPCRARRARR